MKRHFLISLILSLLMLTVSLMLFAELPNQMPVHWNFNGEVDGYGDKSWAAFLMPGFMLLLSLLVFGVLPRFSPTKFEVDGFRNTYGLISVLVVGLLGYIHTMILWASLDQAVDPGRALIAGILLFLIIMGNYMGKVRRNFWMGIRTPWTLASERVWNETHRIGAWSFVAAGILGFVLILANFPLGPVVGILVASALIPVIYSLVRYIQLKGLGEL